MAGRIRIEPYKRLDVHTPPVPGGGYIQVDAGAGRFGPSPLGQQILEIAQGLPAVAQVVSEQVVRDNEAAAKAADTRLGEIEQKLLFDPQHGYLNTRGQQAIEHSTAVLDAYGKAQQREVEAQANDDQRGMVETLAQRRLATFSEQVEHHSSAERLRWHDTTSDRRIATMQADAGFNWSDDALLRRALGTVRAEVRDKAERNGWASPLTEAALRQETSRTLVSAIEAAVEHDPDRALSLRTRYEQHIEAHHLVPLDALLTEAQTRQRAQQASAEILNSTPPDDQTPPLQWQLQQAEAIAEPAVRAAAVRTLHAAAAATEARSRARAEQVLARVLKDSLTDPSQIPVREWAALDAERRQAIETRLDHNAAGTEPAPNPALVDELTTQMTQAPGAFARHDLVPAVAHLPLPQWQRFRDRQAGIRRNDQATEDEIYAVKRGLQLATKMLPANTPDDIATNYRAELVAEIDTWHRINGKNPDDADIASMLKRYVAPTVQASSRFDPNPFQQVVHRIKPPSGRPNRRWKFERKGHHFIPRQVYKSYDFSPEALKVFRGATSGPLAGSHPFDQMHRDYNDAVREKVHQWLKQNNINPRKMTEAQARKLLDHILSNNDRRIRRFLFRIYKQIVRYKLLRRSRGME